MNEFPYGFDTSIEPERKAAMALYANDGDVEKALKHVDEGIEIFEEHVGPLRDLVLSMPGINEDSTLPTLNEDLQGAPPSKQTVGEAFSSFDDYLQRLRETRKCLEKYQANLDLERSLEESSD